MTKLGRALSLLGNATQATNDVVMGLVNDVLKNMQKRPNLLQFTMQSSKDFQYDYG